MRESFEIRDFVAAVALVAGVEFGGFEVLAAGGFHDFARDEILHAAGPKRFRFGTDDLLVIAGKTSFGGRSCHASICACRRPVNRGAQFFELFP